MIPYVSERLTRPTLMPDVPTAWNGIESILDELFDRFRVRRNLCLDMGVQHGFSTAAFANYFNTVIGIDTFAGDEHAGAGDPEQTFRGTAAALGIFSNVILVRSDFRDWITNSRGRYDLIHVDLVHTFDMTYLAGAWALDHSPVVLFHDTRSFPAVMEAVTKLAESTGAEFYEWPESHGLGILVRR